MQNCRFRSSWGGSNHCQDEAYQEGFCRFHFECFLRGEIHANGEIKEMTTNQARRREINFHGIQTKERVYVRE